MSDSNQGGNFMPKEELAASGSGHLLLTDFDDDEKEDVEDSMVEFANQQGIDWAIDKTRYKKYFFSSCLKYVDLPKRKSKSKRGLPLVKPYQFA